MEVHPTSPVASLIAEVRHTIRFSVGIRKIAEIDRFENLVSEFELSDLDFDLAEVKTTNGSKNKQWIFSSSLSNHALIAIVVSL